VTQSTVQPSGGLGPGRQALDRIRVVIGADTFLWRVALEQVCSRFESIEAMAFRGDRDSLMAAIERERPHAVVTDIRMAPTGTDEGIEVARKLRITHPEIGVVVLSQFVEPSHVRAFFESGTARRAYLLIDRVSDREQLASAIQAVVEGRSVIDPEVVEVLVRAHVVEARSRLASLTRRERGVLAEVAQGKSNAAIADSLVLTKRAVEKHINSIFTKLELGSPDDTSRRVKAALLFLANASDENFHRAEPRRLNGR
jgi:DNA-binding NarL/FixJ family response regulator